MPELGRETPYHPAHSTAVAGLVNIKGGDNRFYNNLFVGRGESAAKPAGNATATADGFGLWVYDAREFPLATGGNVYYHGARPYAKEAKPIVEAAVDPQVKLVEEGGGFQLHLTLGPAVEKADTKLVTTELLGKAKIPGPPLRERRRHAAEDRHRLLWQAKRPRQPHARPVREARRGAGGAQGAVAIV